MISVCMATYEGEKYIEEQLTSILSQLSLEDELIISDDGSKDQTLSIIQRYMSEDNRIRLIDGPNNGVVANFEHAMEQSSGEIIFLADQDDVWLPTKVQQIKEFFEQNSMIDLVVSDLMIVDEQLEILESSYFDYRKVQVGFIHNIIKNKYIGAGMAFRKSLKERALPIPKYVPMHDMWLGILAAKQKKSALLKEPLTLYRRHGDNVSAVDTQASISQQIKWRLSLIYALVKK